MDDNHLLGYTSQKLTQHKHSLVGAFLLLIRHYFSSSFSFAKNDIYGSNLVWFWNLKIETNNKN
jgi:hypothetical protein